MTHTFTINRTTFQCRIESKGWPMPGPHGKPCWVINLPVHGDIQGQPATGTELESVESIAAFEEEVRNQVWRRVGKVWLAR